MSIKAKRIPQLFLITLFLGLVLMGSGFALEQYYKANIADKNGDGVKDWKDCDVNNDGKIDLLDTVIISRNAEKPTTAETWRYDINEDGFIDRLDGELVFAHRLSILNLYTNQGKVFITGVILTILSIIGMAVTKRRYL